MRLTGGFDTETYAFDLDEAPDELSGGLVLRLFRDLGQSHRVRSETAVQNMAASSGHPVPRVPVETAGRTILGRPYLIMKRVAGEALLEILSADPPGTAEAAADLLGRTQARLHGLGVTEAINAFRRAGLNPTAYTPFRLLADIIELAQATGDETLTNLGTWLDERQPAPPAAASLCHGDFHPGNVMVENMCVTGVIDWGNVAFGHPEYDVAATRFILSVGTIEGTLTRQNLEAMMAQFIDRYDAAYQALSSLDEQLVRYYTVLRAGHAMARVMAAQYGTDVPGAAHDGYAWSHPPIYQAIRRLVRDETGLDGGPSVTAAG